jgi:hypothetical protein
MVMRLSELAYRTVPGILIFLGGIGLYFVNEIDNLIHIPLYTNLIVIAGVMMVADGITMLMVGWSNTAHHDSNFS